MRIFIDTEFTGFQEEGDQMELISIGLATDDGREFYGELSDFPLDACNPFVIEHVLPLLGKSPGCTYTRRDLAGALHAWLQQFEAEGAQVCYDYFGDVALLRELLGGQLSDWLRYENVDRNLDPHVFEKYFKASNKTQHHALHDEPPRIWWRLQLLREWSYEQETKQIFA